MPYSNIRESSFDYEVSNGSRYRQGKTSRLQDANDKSFEVGFYKIEHDKKTVGSGGKIFDLVYLYSEI